MSAAKHTPGPWFVEEEGAGIYVVTADMMVARPSPMDKHPTDSDEYIDGPQTEANARLIAAAPDLLAALQKALDHCIWPASAISAAEAEARAAIAKATGGTQ